MDRPSRSPKRHHRAMLALLLAAILVPLADAVVSAGADGLDVDDLFAILGVLGFVGIGAVILDRRPGEPVGRVCLAIGLLFMVGTTLRLPAIIIGAERGVMPPAVPALAIVASTLVNMAILLGGPLLISRFPARATGLGQRRLEDA